MGAALVSTFGGCATGGAGGTVPVVATRGVSFGAAAPTLVRPGDMIDGAGETAFDPPAGRVRVGGVGGVGVVAAGAVVSIGVGAAAFARSAADTESSVAWFFAETAWVSAEVFSDVVQPMATTIAVAARNAVALMRAS